MRPRGCGRVLRHLPEVKIVGFDYNPRLVRWVRTNLPFAQARTDGPLPPLDATDSEFDVAYAFSVFTHSTSPPSMLGSAYTPPAWVRSTLLDGWQVTHTTLAAPR